MRVEGVRVKAKGDKVVVISSPASQYILMLPRPVSPEYDCANPSEWPNRSAHAANNAQPTATHHATR